MGSSLMTETSKNDVQYTRVKANANGGNFEAMIKFPYEWQGLLIHWSITFIRALAFISWHQENISLSNSIKKNYSSLELEF